MHEFHILLKLPDIRKCGGKKVVSVLETALRALVSAQVRTTAKSDTRRIYPAEALA
jgi:hypothetical protein